MTGPEYEQRESLDLVSPNFSPRQFVYKKAFQSCSLILLKRKQSTTLAVIIIGQEVINKL